MPSRGVPETAQARILGKLLGFGAGGRVVVCWRARAEVGVVGGGEKGAERQDAVLVRRHSTGEASD